MKSENKSTNTNNIQFIDGTNNYINNKMKRQGYTEDVGYEYGYDQEDESPIKKIIIAGAITAGGIVAYKKGYLKRGISQLISYANDYKAISPTAFKTFRDWVKGKDAETATLKNSIFRTKNLKTFFNALKEDSVKDDTFADFANLKSSFKANIAKTKREHMHGAKRVYDNTDLLYDIKDANKILKPFNTTVKKQIVRNKINEDLIKQYTQTSDDIAKQLKRTGYRKAQLGDILEYRKGTDGKFGLFNINDDVNVDENTISTLLDFIENTTLENGKRVADTDLWKRMTLDKNILFSEKGKFSDLRQAYNSFSLFARSLSTDFQIPFVGLNPLEYTALSKMGLRKPKFGLLGAETIQPHFTKKTGDYTLRDMFKITDDVVVSNHKAYAFIDNEFKKIGDNIELLSVDPNKYGISKDLNSFKKIANIKMRKYEEYNPKNIVDKARFAIGKRLDIGRVDDSKRQFDDGPFSFFSRTLDPDEKIEGISNKLFNKLFSTAYKKEKNIYSVFGEGTKDDSFRRFYYVGVQQRKTIHDVALDPNKNEAIVEYFKQFLYGRNDLDKVNKGSLKTYYLFERMNQSLNGFGLSLSQDSLGSTFDVLKNLTLKRFLPVYGGYQAIQYLNFLTERKKDKDGGENNISTFVGDKVVKANIGLHNLENKLGITKFAKGLKELTPGSDQITELPGINTLKLDKTGEEMAKYYQKGMDPIRKGRYWQLGNTPFTGGKIDYYRPNWYRRLKADADFSEVKYGSRKEYFENAWFPTPTAPLAPLRHFIKDKYHYEEMHYNDRPYLVTAPEFYDVPFVGPVVSSTLGEIVKPQKRMHDEYWNSKNTNTITNNTSSNVNALMYGVDNIKYDITIPKSNFNMQTPNVLRNARTLGNINMSSPLITNNQIQVIKSNNRFGTSTNNFSESFNSINIPKIQQDTSISNFNNSDFLTSKQINDYSAYMNTSDSTKQLSDKVYTKQKLKEYNENKHISTIGTFDDTNQSKAQANVYTTASGSHQVINVDNSKFKHIRKELNVKSIKQIPNTNLRANVVATGNKNKGTLDYNNGELQLSNNVTYDIENSKSMKQTFINQYQNAAEVLGIYGFTGKSFIVGDLGTNKYIIENPRQAYSFNDKFWEQNLGGLGGDLSEIFRRLIQKERKDQNKINPIRNTMPNWMPGCFISGTKVLTETNMKNIEDIVIGDKVYDHLGQLQQVEYVHVGKYNKDFVKIKAKGICNEITATGNHPFYVVSSNYCSYKHSHKRMCIPGVYPNKNKPCKYCKQKQWSNFEWKEARNIKEGDYLAVPIPKNNHSIKEIIIPKSNRKMIKDISNKTIPLNFSFGVFTGYYLSEGYSDKYRLCFCSGKKEPEQNESVKYISNLLDLTYYEKPMYDEKGIGCIVSCIYSKQLSELMSNNFGHLAYNKTLPDWVFNAPLEYQMGIVAGYIQGDGSIAGKGTKISLNASSVSYSLIQKLEMLLAQNGMHSTIKSKVNDYKNILYTISINQKDSITLKKLTNSYGTKISKMPNAYPRNTGCSSVILDNYLLRKVDKVVNFNDNNMVYNLQIANTHTYNVEGVVVHNSNYFTDFKHGDPYSKIQEGELRLQGTPYEQLWGIQDPLKLQIGSSNIGKDVDSIVNHYLHNDTITDSDALDIVDSGTKTHNIIENKWIKSGIAIDTEIKVQDTQNNIIGFYDARIHDKSSKTGEAIVDIKTTNDKTFNKIKSTGIPKTENARQLNYYLWATGNDKGYLYYINRDTDESYTVTVNFDEKMLQDTFDNLNQARNKIMDMYNNGEISRGDLYKPIDRYRILADVAPYSQEFQNMKAILQSSGMDDETKKEYNEINKRMQQQKQANRTYEYKFKYADLDTYKTKITKVDGSSIYVDFNGKERKVNLAGIANGDIVQNKEVLDKKQEVEKYLTKGSKVTLKVNADELTWDKTKGIKAILIDKKGTNINKELVKQGVKVYDKDDNSPTSINVKYNSAQRAFGNLWERIAHMDTYFNTKFLNVRSAKEDYERKDVYGKSWQTWTHPIRDYLIPSIQRDIARPGGLLVGTAAGAMVGSMFGKTKFGSIIGGVAGGATVAIGKLFTKVYEIKNDKKWIPKRRRDERELNEYIDNLKYVKYIRYYNYYKQKALKEDGFDVDNYLRGKQSQASKRKKQISSIENVKVGLKEDYKKKKEKRDGLKKPKPLRISIGNIDNPADKNAAKLFNKASKFINDKFYDLRYSHRKNITAEAKQKVTNANAEINTLKNHREIETLPLNATKAIQYYDMAKKTMRGYQPGDPITNILSALPKKERDRMKYFMKAPKQEREGILNIVPDYVKRPLQSIYGMKPDEQEPLEEYFTKHQLPGADWEGWNENVNLDNVKVKIVNREGYDESEFNIWQQDKDNAIAQGPIALPSVNFRSKAADIKRNLSDVLGNLGVSNLNISYMYDTDNVNIDMDLNYDRSDDIEEEISNTDFV